MKAMCLVCWTKVMEVLWEGKYLFLGVCFFLSHFTLSFTDQILYSVALAFQLKLPILQVFFVKKNRFSFLYGHLEWLIWEPCTPWGISEFTVSKNEKTVDTRKNLWFTERQRLTCSVAWVQVNTTSLLCGHGQGDYALQTWENSLCLLLEAAVRINILQKVRLSNDTVWASELDM